MAANFKISIYRNSENLDLRLNRDFNGSSAHQVINMLKRNYHASSNIF
ncbi:MAG: hypothetical protein JSV60_11700 [Desulfobacterales bacterium]|nr:MAG: hypothetical protein JSV60_11700 [Desulfobacterales bacterium]